MKVRPIVLIVPLTILVVALAIGSSLLFRIFVLLIVIGLVGIVWAATGVRRLSLQSGEIPDHSHVGGQFKEELTVINNSKLPKILLKAEEQTSLPGHHNLTVLNLPGDSSETWESTVECRRRGQHTLGSLKVTSGDPFDVH
jgi:uncharacterized protein (DUF58 family)